MARSFHLTYDQLKTLIPNLSVTEYALVEIMPENAPINPTGGNVQAEENASHGSCDCISVVEIEELNRRCAPMREMPASQHNVQSYSVFPGTVMMENAASDPAEHDTVYHLQTIPTHQQVVQTVGLLPNNINEQTGMRQIIIRSSNNNCSALQERELTERQSSTVNSSTPGRMLLLDPKGEEKPILLLTQNELTQDCGEQQQILAQQDHSTKQSQQIVTRPTGIQRDNQTQTSFVRDHQTVTVTKPCPENSRTTSQKSSQAVGQTLGKLEFTSRIVPLNANQRRLIGHGVLEPSSAHSSGEIPISRKRYLEERKVIPGKLAHCRHCGYDSDNFLQCDRCNRKIPENCKIVRDKQFPLSKDGISCQNFDRGSHERTMAGNIQKSERTFCKKPRVRFQEDPEILTISSDEDEETESKLDVKSKEEYFLDPVTGLLTINSMDEPVLPPITSALEPVIKEEENPITDEETDFAEEIAAGVQDEQNGVLDESLPVYLTCRSVRIGSYKYYPTERVVICKQGVRMCVPGIEDGTEMITIKIRLKYIEKALIHFGQAMPVIFLYIKNNFAVHIRSVLNMSREKEPYYDPTSNEETLKRIILLPEKLSEDAKTRLKVLFGLTDLLIELNHMEANDILVKSSPKEVQENLKKALSRASPKCTTATNEYVQKILIYPPPPAKGGITINPEDYCCLGEDQFLNDVIIDFYLKYLTLNCLSEEDQRRTHVFSSFFYKRLTSRPVRSARRHHPLEFDSATTPAEKRHARVKSWTKTVDIFEKDFIVIPINESSHWFLAIICFPGLNSPRSMSDGSPVMLPPSQPNRAKKMKGGMQESEMESNDAPSQTCILKSIQIGSTTITPITSVSSKSVDERDILDDASDRDEAEGDEEDMQMPSESEDETQPEDKSMNEVSHTAVEEDPEKMEVKNVKKKEIVECPEGIPENAETEYCSPNIPIKQPCILIFDSLAGSSRSKVVATLRDYLSIEYKVKKGKFREFSKDTIRGACPRVPQQTNFVDCGVYVLQYAESFFQKPIKDYRIPIRSLAQWFPEEVAHTKREAIHHLILKLMKEQNITCQLPKITLPSPASRANQPKPLDEEGMKKLGSKLVKPGQLIIKSKEGGHRLVTGGLRVIPFTKNSLNLVLETQSEPLASVIQVRSDKVREGEEKMDEDVNDEMEEGEVIEPENDQMKQLNEVDGGLCFNECEEGISSPVIYRRNSKKKSTFQSDVIESNDNESPKKKSKR